MTANWFWIVFRAIGDPGIHSSINVGDISSKSKVESSSKMKPGHSHIDLVGGNGKLVQKWLNKDGLEVVHFTVRNGGRVIDHNPNIGFSFARAIGRDGDGWVGSRTTCKTSHGKDSVILHGNGANFTIVAHGKIGHSRVRVGHGVTEAVGSRHLGTLRSLGHARGGTQRGHGSGKHRDTTNGVTSFTIAGQLLAGVVVVVTTSWVEFKVFSPDLSSGVDDRHLVGIPIKREGTLIDTDGTISGGEDGRLVESAVPLATTALSEG